MPVFDLRRDGKTLLEREWLQEGEWLRECAPSWSLTAFEGIPKPYPTAGQAWAAAGRFVARLPVYLFVSWVVLLAGESGGDVGTSSPRRPAAVVWGDGLASRAGSLAAPALRRPGIWALTDRRVAFLGVRGRTRSRLLSAAPTPRGSHEGYRPAPIETVAEFPADEWAYAGTVERTRTTRLLKRTKSIGEYARIVFADGSGIDVRKG
ncbi:hypothetical protein K3N28_12510 [Glycomyces sp. TRM65418]|uniref:hypothetical protein n=1 Tax=Glycomyces sp. TRM65418 TaxID=2867006 RepID=UPI001CE4DAC4|nr:hypothetical protein [Glycomyces sp. TRM65418]MCC3763886.1 hypothetical protein [Glycomyces sp. TRM65418]QZD53589.1 hypothetical protein K3N28_12440 [Glycomyces sp. TRM65418]